MNQGLTFGEKIGHVKTSIPGPKSLRLADEITKVETPGITYLSKEFPVFWEKALGSNVEDVDGNTYVDLSAAFGVASLGHAHPSITKAIHSQLDLLPHGMGDVHPPRVKVELLKVLSNYFPGSAGQAILCSAGAEAVEAALKTAYLYTQKPGVLVFEGAYHGLTYGALALGGQPRFSEPFHSQLGRFARKARFPKASSDQNRDLIDRSISEIHSEIEQSKKAGCPIGAVLLEPILGRGGVVVPPRGWLRAVRELADRQGVLLIADEIMTGFGRTGKRFAVDHENIKPDLLCVGKSLTGTLPFSACIGSKKVMNAWPKSTGEALHTSTFLGHPLGCVAAIAGIQEIEIKGLAARADRLGKEILEELQAWKKVIPFVDEVRGQGLFLGIVLSKNFDRGIAFEVAKRALAKGVIVLPSGPTGNVLSLSPPLTIGGRQLKWGISVLRDVLVAMS